MSKKSAFVFIVILALLAGVYFAFNIYTKDKILALKTDLSKKGDERLFVDFLLENNNKCTYLDINLGNLKKESFLDEQNRTNYIHLRSFMPKKYEYIFILNEDGRKNLIFDNNASNIKGLFNVNVQKNEDNKSFIYLRAISPEDYNRLKKLQLNKNN